MSSLLARFSVLALLALSQSVIAASHCVLLQYHHVSASTPPITSVTPELFQAHLDHLKENDFSVMALENVIELVQEGRELPDKCVALTIDDAYVSIYTEAAPRAARYGYPLTVFVSTDAVDQGLDAFMSWEQMRELQAKGVTFQNHSQTHEHLVRRSPGESDDDWELRIAQDVLVAQNRIQQELGVTPTMFAYPYGEYTSVIKAMIRSMGLVGFGQQSGPIWPGADFGALPRFPMGSVYASMNTFPTKVATIPLPIVSAQPAEPIVDLDQWRPTLKLSFEPDSYLKDYLTCFANGSPAVTYTWSESEADTVEVQPEGKLKVGRNRYNCTMPSRRKGRFHWYSHNWIRRQADGGWYREP